MNSEKEEINQNRFALLIKNRDLLVEAINQYADAEFTTLQTIIQELEREEEKHTA